MRASFYPHSPDTAPPGAFSPPPDNAPSLFLPFDTQAFAIAHKRNVPVFLIIGDLPPEITIDPSLSAQIAERTVAVHLLRGQRPDVEAMCLRTSVRFSEEGGLPLCALLLPNGCPFLAAPLPPPGYPLDTQRLFVWLAYADRRFTQNLAAFTHQAAQIAHSFHVEPLRKPYMPHDASHDLMRALSASEDRQSGGFGQIKAPFVCGLRFLLHAGSRGDSAAHAMLTRVLSAMLSSAVYDPLDGGFFRSSLTDDWRGFVPQKPLGVNALLALTLLENGRRAEAIRTLDFILNTLSLEGGAFAPFCSAPLQTYAFTPHQVCAALGHEEGLRACRLLRLLRQYAKSPPSLAPSRFSPPAPENPRRSEEDEPPLCPVLTAPLTPEDAAFLRRALPVLLRARAARPAQRPASYLLSEDCAIAAWVFAVCGRRLGELRYTQAAQRAVSALLRLCPPADGFASLPPSFAPASALYPPRTAGAAASLSLALLALGQSKGLESYADAGLRTLGAALHAFLRKDGALLHTPEDPAACFPRIPAIEDSELPAPAASLVRALRLADALRPQAHYLDAADLLWHYAAPHAKAAPMAHAGLIDAMES